MKGQVEGIVVFFLLYVRPFKGRDSALTQRIRSKSEGWHGGVTAL